jgi:hypothetical protein
MTFLRKLITLLIIGIAIVVSIQIATGTFDPGFHNFKEW